MPASSPRRRHWDSDIHDLSIFRATRLEREQRRLRHQSPNAEEARKDLEERRRALAGGNFKYVLEALDKHNRALLTNSECSRPLLAPRLEPNREMTESHSLESCQCHCRECITSDVASSKACPKTDVGEKEEEVQGNRTHDRHQKSPLLQRRGVLCAAGWDAPHLADESVQMLEPKTAPDQLPGLKGDEVKEAPECHGPTVAPRRPDKLGLARLQDGIQRLEAVVTECEGLRHHCSKNVSCSAIPTSARAMYGAGGLRSKAACKRSAEPTTFLDCNQKAIEVFTRLAKNLSESEMEKRDLQRVCKELQVELKRSQCELHIQSQESVADILLLRNEIISVQHEQDHQLEMLRERLALVESMNKEQCTCRNRQLYESAPNWTSTPVPATRPATTDDPHLNDCTAGLRSEVARLFTPLRPKMASFAGTPESSDRTRPFQEGDVDWSLRNIVATSGSAESHISQTGDGDPVESSFDLHTAQLPSSTAIARRGRVGPVATSMHAFNEGISLSTELAVSASQALPDLPSNPSIQSPLLATYSEAYSAFAESCTANEREHQGNRGVPIELAHLPKVPTANDFARWGSWGKRFSDNLRPPIQHPFSIHEALELSSPRASAIANTALPDSSTVVDSCDLDGIGLVTTTFQSPRVHVMPPDNKDLRMNGAAPMTPRTKVPRPTSM